MQKIEQEDGKTGRMILKIIRLPVLLSSCSLVFLGIACGSETLPEPAPPPVDWHSFEVVKAKAQKPAPPAAKEQPIAEKYLKALVSPKMADLGPLLDENVHCLLPNGDDARGRGDVIAAHQALFASFDDLMVLPTRIFRTPSAQIVEWRLSGRVARAYMGAAANDKQIVASGMTVLSVRADGLITDAHVHFDAALVKAELGVGPKVLVDLPQPAWTTEPPAIVGPVATVDGEAQIALVRGSLDALANNDDAKLVAAMADDVEVRTQDRTEPMRGKDQIRAHARSLHASIAQLDTTVRSAYAVGPFVVVEYQISGEQVAPIGWVPAQRMRVPHIEVADVVELKDGKISRITRYDNRGYLLPPDAAPEKPEKPKKP